MDKSPDEPQKLNESNKPASSGRRKLIIGSVPIMASLMSRPLWAEGSTWGRCTISGALSGPSSSHEEVLCQGLTPGYWKNHAWPYYEQGTCTSNGNGQGGGNCTWDNSGTKFSAVFSGCIVGLLSSAYPDFEFVDASLMTILQEDKSGNSSSTHPALQFAFHVVAGLLNSASDNVNYGYTRLEFISLVDNWCTSGGQLGDLGVISMEQFKDLLDHRNNGDFNWMPV